MVTSKVVSIANQLHKKSYTELAAFGLEVKTGIAGNSSVFVTPPMTMTVFGTALATFATAIGPWGTVGNRGSKTDLANLQAARNIVVGMLNELAAYVQIIARGDGTVPITDQRTVVTLARMRIKNTSAPVGLFNPPVNFRQVMKASLQNTGKIYMDWKKPMMDNLAATPDYYNVFTSEDGVTNWVLAGVTQKTNFTYNSGSIGTRVFLRICAGGSAGDGGVTSTLSAIGQ